MPRHLGCDLASTRHVETSGTGQPVDTVPVRDGHEILLTAQNISAYNGVYVVSGGQWQRRADFVTREQMEPGTTFYVAGGTENQGSEFYFSGSRPTTVDADNLYFDRRSYSRPVGASGGLELDRTFPTSPCVALPEQYGVQGDYSSPIVSYDARGIATYAESGDVQEGLLEGLDVARLSATSIEISEGRAWIPGGNAGEGELLTVDFPITKSGLVLPASSVVWLYLWSNGGVEDVEFSTQIPATPYYRQARVKGGPSNADPDTSPDETRRWIGQLVTNASGGIRSVFSASSPSGHFTNGDGPTVFSAVTVTSTAPTVSTDLRGVGGVPPDARGVVVMVRVLAQPSNRDLYLDAAGAPPASANSPRHRSGGIFTSGQYWVPLGTGVEAGKIQLSVVLNEQNNDVSVWVTGWWR